MGNRPQDETPHPLEGVRPLGDDQLDRPEVEAQQCVELTGTNGRGLTPSGTEKQVLWREQA